MSSTVRVWPENTRIDVLFDRNIEINNACLQIFEEYFENNSVIWLCFSWWPDSTYLLIQYLHRLNLSWKKNYKSLTLLHYMHHVREDDYIDFEFITKICNCLWIRYCIASYTWDDYREESLRSARRDRIDSVCLSMWITHLLTWHTFNDRIETSILNCIRGCNWQWRQSMPVLSMRCNNIVKYIRPLLSINKLTIERFLLKNKLPYLIDPTNFDKSVSERNRLRVILENNGIWLYDNDWRTKMYTLLESNEDLEYRVLPCNIHPQWWEWTLLKLCWVWWSNISLKQLSILINKNNSYSSTQDAVWKNFIWNHWYWWFAIWDHWILKTNNEVYYTTLYKDFWKDISYTYGRCEGTWWIAWRNTYRYKNMSLKKRMKLNVPVFWRNCLPVEIKNDTVQKIYSLIR